MNIDYLKQTENQVWIKYELGTELMIPVYGKIIDSKYDILLRSYLCPIADIDKHMADTSYIEHIFAPGVTIYGNEDDVYFSWGNDKGLEPIAIERNFEGLQEDTLEIVQEFILLFNLSNAVDRNVYRDLSNGEIKVIEIKDGLVYIHKKYLKTYLALKEKALIFHVNSRCVALDAKVIEVCEEYISDDSLIRLTLNIGSCNCIGENQSYSLLNAKKVLLGCEKSKCNVWPYNQKMEYLEFVLGIDEDGDPIKYSCDPNGLRNCFGANENAPYYLTPVCFNKTVLDKYRNRPDIYKIEDGVLRCGSKWALYIDNHHKDYVSVYLGDLGRDLPSVDEQHYWRGFNKPIAGVLSQVKFQRDFEVKFSSATDQPFVFINTYSKFNEAWREKFDWNFYLDFKHGDEYNLDSLRIPDASSINEFDILVLSLNKVMCDSLNEDQILKQLQTKDEIKGSIYKLAKWLEKSGKTGYDDHIKFLRNLQELRSSGTGHRKGDNYEKICKKMSIEHGKYDVNFTKLLDGATSVIRYLASEFFEE